MGMAVWGAVLFLNLVSLREFILHTHVPTVIAVVFLARDDMSRARAQGLELLIGLAGAALLLVTTLWHATSRR
jgi:hypothetical protein